MATQTLTALTHKKISATSSGTVTLSDHFSDWETFTDPDDYEVIPCGGGGYGYAHTKTATNFYAGVVLSPAYFLIVPMHPPIVDHVE